MMGPLEKSRPTADSLPPPPSRQNLPPFIIDMPPSVLPSTRIIYLSFPPSWTKHRHPRSPTICPVPARCRSSRSSEPKVSTIYASPTPPYPPLIPFIDPHTACSHMRFYPRLPRCSPDLPPAAEGGVPLLPPSLSLSLSLQSTPSWRASRSISSPFAKESPLRSPPCSSARSSGR